MAAGDFTLYEEAKLALLDGTHDLDTHVIKIALYGSGYTPTASEAAPVYTVTNEVTDVGSYVAGGVAITITLSEVGGTVTFNATDPSWAVNASNTTDATWGVIYNFTAAGTPSLGYVDLAGPVDMTIGALTITWNALGLFTLA